jgi:predicted MFS family arabinose efflux permease
MKNWIANKTLPIASTVIFVLFTAVGCLFLYLADKDKESETLYDSVAVTLILAGISFLVINIFFEKVKERVAFRERAKTRPKVPTIE